MKAVTTFPNACIWSGVVPGVCNALSAGTRASENSRWSRQSNNHADDATRKTNQ